MSLSAQVHEMKLKAPVLSALPSDVRSRVLEACAKSLRERKDEIFQANREDCELASASGIKTSILKRLSFDEGKLSSCAEGLLQLSKLKDPVGRITLSRELDEGLTLRRVTVPIGVIGVIFEARPDALVQITGLCVKSANCAILKGGKEAKRTNEVLFGIMKEAAQGAGLPSGCLMQVSAHEEIDEILTLDGDVDLIIPRGSNSFVRYIMDHTKIPVMGHADGICHIYVDKAADMGKAIAIVIDAKTQYPAACNAVETILVDRRIAGDFLPLLGKAFADCGVVVHGDEETSGLIHIEGDVLTGEDYRHEYGDLEVAIRVVDGVDEAIDHIARYGSHHTDAIVTEDDAAATRFLRMVDSAGVYRNCSTRFSDGFRYGFGAEVGISTGKIHARGPVGIEGLTTYKYELLGDGQVVAPYVSGERAFHFKDL